MRELTIQKNDSGQRLDKYLKKLLPNASSGFLYKMLRKKNITLNNRKADGKETLTQGDIVKVFFADDTFEKFSKDNDSLQAEYEMLRGLPMKGLKVIYEDEDILGLDKPANMLSQKADMQDLSANEYMLGYLIREGALTLEDMQTFRPSVCNRLDRNTTGILLAGKSLQGLQQLSSSLKSRDVHKYYHAVVAGEVKEEAHLKGYLQKDEKNNQVQIFSKADWEQLPQRERPADARWIETAYRPLKFNGEVTLLEIHLITGRSHQIRAHLASVGHPVVGDQKYGNAALNCKFRTTAHIHHQLLHACRVEFEDGRIIKADDPQEFIRIL